MSISVIAETTGTGTVVSSLQEGRDVGQAGGAHIVIDVTAITVGLGTGLTPTIQGYDSVSGKYYALLVGSTITGTGTTVLKICPGITAVANSSASDMMPDEWRVSMANDTTTATYTVSVNYG